MVDPSEHPWPFAPGEGPFHVKGIAYAFHMEYVRDVLPGGPAAQAEALADPALAAFFDQTFFATSWYDLWPLVVAGEACGAISGLGFEGFVRRRAQHQVERDLGVVRRAILAIARPSAIAVRVPKINASYFDFVSLETRAAGPKAVEGTVHGLPGGTVRWYQLVTETFLRELLTRGGAERVETRWRRRVLEGQAHGLPTYASPYEVRWR